MGIFVYYGFFFLRLVEWRPTTLHIGDIFGQKNGKIMNILPNYYCNVYFVGILYRRHTESTQYTEYSTVTKGIVVPKIFFFKYRLKFVKK